MWLVRLAVDTCDQIIVNGCVFKLRPKKDMEDLPYKATGMSFMVIRRVSDNPKDCVSQFWIFLTIGEGKLWEKRAKKLLPWGSKSVRVTKLAFWIDMYYTKRISCGSQGRAKYRTNHHRNATSIVQSRKKVKMEQSNRSTAVHLIHHALQ